MTTFLNHITLDTGQLRPWPRSEWDDGVLTVIAERLEAALADPQAIVPIPAADPLGLQALADGRALIATLHVPLTDREAAIADHGRRPWAPLVIFGVAPRATVAARLWPMLVATVADPPQNLERPSAPWCAAHPYPALTRYPHLVDWIVPAERAIAWAWIDHVEQKI